jgi:hypothetical protein
MASVLFELDAGAAERAYIVIQTISKRNLGAKTFRSQKDQQKVEAAFGFR